MEPRVVSSIGFSGTQFGMSDEQKQALYDKLLSLSRFFEWFHHGDCVGADEEAAILARDLGYKIACHPPRNMIKRAFQPADYSYPMDYYLSRNRGIVNQSTFLIAAPFSMKPRLRSGTWMTVRYARSCDKHVHILRR